MSVFDKHPKIRIFFVIIYLLSVFMFWDKSNPIVFNIFLAALMLLCVYISLVKANVVKDKNSEKINTIAFDISSIMFLTLLITSFFN